MEAGGVGTEPAGADAGVLNSVWWKGMGLHCYNYTVCPIRLSAVEPVCSYVLGTSVMRPRHKGAEERGAAGGRRGRSGKPADMGHLGQNSGLGISNAVVEASLRRNVVKKTAGFYKVAFHTVLL